jgi:hypothetical protein
MTIEAEVRLLCPDCEKTWRETPRDLPGPREDFTCPACDSTRTTAEFARTDHDLQALKQLG